MASATSPVSRAVHSFEEGPVSSKKFSELIKYFQVTHKALMEMCALVNKLPANQSLKFDNHTFKSSDINTYSRIYIAQLGELKPIFNRRNKRVHKGGEQLQKPFFLSDQIVDFYKDANLGPSDPDKPRSKLSKEIDLITKKHMATSGILTSLFTNYIEANDLKAVDSEGKHTGRFLPDDRMLESFSDCIYTLHGKDISKRKCREGTVSDKVSDIQNKVLEGKKTAFERVKDRVDSRSDEPYYDKKRGLLYTVMMVFNNFYRIPGPLLTDKEREVLQDQENIDSCKELQEKLSKITEHRNAKKAKAKSLAKSA